MPADLPHRRNDVLAHLLRDARQLVLAEPVQVLRAIDAIEKSLWLWSGRFHEVRV
jgi:hypothetical protein